MSQFYISNNGGGGSGEVYNITGDTGLSVTGNIKLLGSTGSAQAGSSVTFNGSSTTELDLSLTDAYNNIFLGSNSGNKSATMGGNIGIGNNALYQITSGEQNIGIGINALQGLTTGSYNTVLGHSAGDILTTGNYNTLLGYDAGNQDTGSYNVCVGYLSGTNYENGESNNICIGAVGTSLESSVVRIGTPASGGALPNQTKCYIAGIYGSTPTSGDHPQPVVCDNIGNVSVISPSTAGYVYTSNGTSTPSFQPSGLYNYVSPLINYKNLGAKVIFTSLPLGFIPITYGIITTTVSLDASVQPNYSLGWTPPLYNDLFSGSTNILNSNYFDGNGSNFSNGQPYVPASTAVTVLITTAAVATTYQGYFYVSGFYL